MACASTPLLRLIGDEVLAETKQLGASGDAWGWECDFPGSPGSRVQYFISCVGSLRRAR